MGIQGLLPLLKSTMLPIHIKELDGRTVAVDTYSWLHKGALSCSIQLCKGLPTKRHIEYCMHRVNLLRHYGVKPMLVFDGGFLPMKIEQEEKRARLRKENLARATEHEANGNYAAAYECYQKAVDISPSIAHELILVLKQENVSFIVAPYEADAQMTFLAVSKKVDAVITEDSDLIPFGCPRIIYKMDKYGQGVEFLHSRIWQNKELSFAGFTKDMILGMCILSGCDYLQSLPGMGLKRAHALITKFRSYDKVIKHLRYSMVSVPPQYEESFKKAILTFQHQRVYDPITENIVHLSNISENVGDDLDFLGPLIPQHLAQGIAKGDLDPFTQLPLQGESAGGGFLLSGASELKSFKPESGRKKLDLPVQKNLLTKYFCFASLEAKRKFQAPRMSPPLKTASPLTDTSFSSKEYCSGNVDCSLASPLDFEDLENTPPDNSVESGSATEVIAFSRSTNPGMADKEGSLRHIPCQILLKECDYKHVPSDVHGKTRIENEKIIVRSSYFKHNSKNRNDGDGREERLSVKGDVDIFKDNIPDNSYRAKTADKKVIVRRSYFQQKSLNEDDQDRQARHLVKDDLGGNISEDITLETIQSLNDGDHREVHGKTRIENEKIIMRSSYFKHNSKNRNDEDNREDRLSIKGDVDIFKDNIPDNSYIAKTANKMVIVRSSYFQQKSLNEDDQDRQARQLVKDDLGANISEDITLETACCENENANGITMKRKASPDDFAQSESIKPKHLRLDASSLDHGCFSANLDDADEKINRDEEKFGSNISHVNSYSDIAEKSMERFVSVISSFRCNSSGTRASGLRAPLKDIRNTCHTRSNAGLDFTQFAYKPSKQKTTAASRRS